MKKSMAILLSLATAASIMTFSGQAASMKSSAITNKPVTIKWFQFQIENATQVKNLAKAYHKAHPNVTIDVDVMGDGYFDVLKTRAASGDMPDLFMTKGYAYLTTYKDYMVNQNSQPFVKNIVNAAKSCISLDGKVMGLPVQMGGWGILYNKAIFKKYKLSVPKTFTQLKKVCTTLKAKGITPFVDQYKDAWMLGHLTGSGYGRVNNATAFIKNLNGGTAKLAKTKEMADDMKFLDLTLQYGQQSPLSTDQNSACTLMAKGKGAMMPEGDWAYSTILQVNPKAEIGMFGVPTTDNASQTKIASDVNGVWHCCSKSSADKQAVVENILNWIPSSAAGKDFVCNQCKFIPAYKGLKSKISSVGNDIAAAISSDKTSIWGWLDAPDGYESDSGTVLQDYINKQLTSSQTLQKLDETWQKDYSKE